MNRSTATCAVVLAFLLGSAAHGDDFGDALRALQQEYPGAKLDDARSAAKRYEQVIKDYRDHPQVNRARVDLVRLVRGFQDPALTSLGAQTIADAIAHEEGTETATIYINFHIDHLRHDPARDLPRCLELAKRMVNRLAENGEAMAELSARLQLAEVLIEQEKLEPAIHTLFAALDRATECHRDGDFDRDPLKRKYGRVLGYYLEVVLTRIARTLGNLPRRSAAGEFIPLIRRNAVARESNHSMYVEMILEGLDALETQRCPGRAGTGPSFL
jgi:hypothetical protein